MFQLNVSIRTFEVGLTKCLAGFFQVLFLFAQFFKAFVGPLHIRFVGRRDSLLAEFAEEVLVKKVIKFVS